MAKKVIDVPDGDTPNGGPRSNVPPKLGYQGWFIVRVVTKRQMKVAPAGFARINMARAGMPACVMWPVLDDYDGPKRMIDAMMETDLDYLHELTLRFPEHHFGFEDVLLKDHVRGREVVERVVLRTQALPRDHCLSIEAVKLLDERLQVVAYCRRGAKTIAEEVLYDSLDGEPVQTDGTGSALLTMSVPE